MYSEGLGIERCTHLSGMELSRVWSLRVSVWVAVYDIINRMKRMRLSKSDKRFAKRNNRRGKCGGCAIYLKRRGNSYISVGYWLKRLWWCDSCRDRLNKGYPIRWWHGFTE